MLAVGCAPIPDLPAPALTGQIDPKEPFLANRRRMVGLAESGRLPKSRSRREAAESPWSMPVEPMICAYSPLRGDRRLGQFVEQRLGLFEVGGVEALGKPAEDGGE